MIPIFCPSCRELILDNPDCPSCGWQRPSSVGGAMVWRAELGRQLARPTYPAVARGRYCIASEGGAVVALDLLAGQVVWERTLDQHCSAHAVTSAGDLVFVAPVDNRTLPPAEAQQSLLALDAQTGEQAWAFVVPAHSLSAAVVAGDALYFTASNDQLYALDARTGRLLWSVEHASWGLEAPAVGAGLVIAGGRGEQLIAYDATSGALRWRFAAGGWFVPQPQVSEGRVVTLCWDGQLYALDLPTGRLLWQRRGERGKGFTSPPIVAGDRVIIGSRVNRRADLPNSSTYALVALNIIDGEPGWRYDLQRPLQVPPAIAGDTPLLASDDGALIALDLASGSERWQSQVGTRFVAQPRVAGADVLLAERDGTCYAVRWQAESASDLLLPTMYMERGERESAALAYALNAEYAQAAEIYAQLDQPREAALLYQRAEEPGRAAALWEQIGDLHRAADLYEAAGDLPHLAEVLAHSGQVLRAAQIYEQVNLRDQAAQLYEQSGDRMRAAELYAQIGKAEQARIIWDSLGKWERIVEYFVSAGKAGEAAAILEHHEQPERAAQLYEQADLPQQALRVRQSLGHWEQVAQLAERIGQYETQAVALERLGRTLAAAEAYEQAGQQASKATPPDNEHIAQFYERAGQLYVQQYDEERAAVCHHQVIRYRQLPKIVVSRQSQDVFAEYEWNLLQLQLTNSGYGRAIGITITLRGPFELYAPQAFTALASQRTVQCELSVRPQKDQYGKLPLDIVVSYRDTRGERYETVQRVLISVRTDDSPVPFVPGDEIERQRQLLATYRSNLYHLLNQAAKYGGEGDAPLNIINDIRSQRYEIATIKIHLRTVGVVVNDEYNDQANSQ